MEVNDFPKKEDDGRAPENCECELSTCCKILKAERLTNKEAVDASNDLRVTGSQTRIENNLDSLLRLLAMVSTTETFKRRVLLTGF
jgi:hypothetical protein